MNITYLSYNPDTNGFKAIKDASDIIAGALNDFTLIADNDQIQIYAKGDISERGIVNEAHCYVVVYGLDMQFFIKIEAYLIGKDIRNGTSHYDYSRHLLTFLEKYTPYLSVLPILFKQLGVS
jgi:hypothetical protein